MERKILQIMPADGWEVRYTPEPNQPSLNFTDALVCWALVEEEDGSTRVCGMITGDPASLVACFADEIDLPGNYRKSTKGV